MPSDVKWCRAGDLYESDEVVTKATYNQGIKALESHIERLKDKLDEFQDIFEADTERSLEMAEELKRCKE